MTTQTEALKMALEAYLCREMPAGTIIGDPKWWVPKIAIAIKEALAQPEQEPVAVYGYCPECGSEGVARERRPDGNDCCANGHTYPSRTANKTPQRTWVGLTIQEANELWESTDSDWELMKRTEAKLKEKNQ